MVRPGGERFHVGYGGLELGSSAVYKVITLLRVAVPPRSGREQFEFFEPAPRSPFWSWPRDWRL